MFAVRGLEELACVCVVADVCRDELLFEMDAEAAVDRRIRGFKGSRFRGVSQMMTAEGGIKILNKRRELVMLPTHPEIIREFGMKKETGQPILLRICSKAFIGTTEILSSRAYSLWPE